MTDPTVRLTHPVSTAELERRWAATRAAMADAGIDVLVTQASQEFYGGYVKWFTDIPAKYGFFDSVVFFADAPMTVIRSGPAGPGRELGGTDPVHRGVGRLVTAPYWPSLNHTATYDAEAIAAEIEPRGRITVGTVGTACLSHASMSYLRSGALPEATFVDATDLVDAIKAVKSPEEQALIRRTAEMQDAVFAAVLDAIRPGLHDYEVTALAQKVGHELGSEQGLFLACSAPMGEASVIGPRHFQGRKLEPGDQFSLLIENNGPGGFYTEIGRNIVLGRAPQRLHDEMAIAVEAQRHTLGLLQPGALPGDILDAHNTFLAARGRPEEKRLYSHGQGYDLVERPSMHRDETLPIAAGMNIVVHPTYVLDDAFVWVCDNYLVGENGPGECLHRTEKKIFEVE